MKNNLVKTNTPNLRIYINFKKYVFKILFENFKLNVLPVLLTKNSIL